MSEIAIGTERPAAGPFNRMSALLIVAVGAAAFLAMLVLGAYAPDLRKGNNGGAHALSNASTGFSGLVRLANATARHPIVVRSEHQLAGEELAVMTPERAETSMTDALAMRKGKATLVVLPKWSTEAHELRAGWVRANGLLPTYQPEGVLAPAETIHISRYKGAKRPIAAAPAFAMAGIHFREPAVVQSFTSKQFEPILVDAKGRMILGKQKDEAVYLLADPDLINNHGIAERSQAAAALAMLDFLNSGGSNAVLFDVTLNGLGRSRSPLRLVFDPPFLAVTVAILAALLLAGWQAVIRFGAPERPERAIAFGKGALVENSAALIRKAGREASLGSRYAAVARERAAALLRLPGWLQGSALENKLDDYSSGQPFSDIAREAEAARNRNEVLAAARRMQQWIRELAA